MALGEKRIFPEGRGRELTVRDGRPAETLVGGRQTIAKEFVHLAVDRRIGHFVCATKSNL